MRSKATFAASALFIGMLHKKVFMSKPFWFNSKKKEKRTRLPFVNYITPKFIRVHVYFSFIYLNALSCCLLFYLFFSSSAWVKLLDHKFLKLFLEKLTFLFTPYFALRFMSLPIVFGIINTDHALRHKKKKNISKFIKNKNV